MNTSDISLPLPTALPCRVQLNTQKFENIIKETHGKSEKILADYQLTAKLRLSASFFFNLLTKVSKKLRNANSINAAKTMTKQITIKTSRAVA